MPVEFLTDDQAARYGRFAEGPSRTELDRLCFLDDADRALVAPSPRRRFSVGFALQLVTVRSLGTFLTDPLDVPTAVVDFVAISSGSPNDLESRRRAAGSPAESRGSSGYAAFAVRRGAGEPPFSSLSDPRRS